MIRNYPFHARSTIKRIIRMRKRLILNDQSKGDKFRLLRNIEQLEKLLNYYPFNTRETMSRFVIRQAPDIMALIPGKGSRSHEKMMADFDEIYNEAIAIRDEKPKPALV